MDSIHPGLCALPAGMVEKMKKPIVSIVIGSYNRHKFLQAAVESARENCLEIAHEIIVIDGGSTDGSLDYLVKQKDIISIVQHNRGEILGKKIEQRSWGYFMNLGFKITKGKYILMISDDCLLTPGSVKNGIDYFEELLRKGERVGAMAFYWRNWPEQEDYWVGLTLGNKMFVNHGLYLRDALEDVGWIDEETYRFYHADGDLCLKLWKAGYIVRDCKKAFVEHKHHTGSKRINNKKDWNAYLKKWEGVFYFHESPQTGGWNYLSYIDPTYTSSKFPKMTQKKKKDKTKIHEKYYKKFRNYFDNNE